MLVFLPVASVCTLFYKNHTSTFTQKNMYSHMFYLPNSFGKDKALYTWIFSLKNVICYNAFH